MATIKSYTDLEQSKKLAEILPLESADMWHHGFFTPSRMCKIEYNPPAPYHSVTPQWDCPCWSLASLLVILPTMIGGEFDEVLQLKMDKHLRGFHFWYISLDTDKVKEGLDIVELNPVDACVKMIERLHDLNLL